MRRFWTVVVAAMVAAMGGEAMAKPKWALAVHGGAGVIARESLTPDQETAYREAMAAAAKLGGDLLARGGSALDAVEAVARLMEDDPLFNAGKGAVFTADGKNELDASIMDGATLNAGAVARVTRTKHPITLARTVMAQSPHVFLSGAEADAFAESQKLEMVDPAYFFTERRWKSLVRALDKEGLPVPPRPSNAPGEPRAGLAHDEGKHGTIGVVALDAQGNVAAATSTGGVTAKRWGRIGDSPIIGAGNYASNKSCAVSATGTGEYFIRLTVAREVCALVQYKGLKLQAAMDEVIQKQLTAIGGDGGAIAVSPDGQLAWSFNTPGMYRAKIADGQAAVVGLYHDDP